MRRKWLYSLIGATAVLIAVGVYFARDQITLAEIGTAFVAKQTCSCLFVSRRQADSCKGDFDPAAAQWLSWQIEARSVTVSAFLIIRSTAIYEDGFGCHLTR